MVGGQIVEILRHKKKAGVLWLNCINGRDQCAVYCDPGGLQPKVGDRVWWQGGKVFWTPREQPEDQKCFDIELRKVGYSGVARPSLWHEKVLHWIRIKMGRCPMCGLSRRRDFDSDCWCCGGKNGVILTRERWSERVGL